MSDQPDNQVLDFLRENFSRVHAKLDLVAADAKDLKVRMSALEANVAYLHVTVAGQNSRLDRVDARLERIERRLELTDTPAG